jgi:hypothetical protein
MMDIYLNTRDMNSNPILYIRDVIIFIIIIIIIIYLNCKLGFTIRHNTQITHHTQTNTAHKTTQTVKDTLHIMNVFIFSTKYFPLK